MQSYNEAFGNKLNSKWDLEVKLIQKSKKPGYYKQNCTVVFCTGDGREHLLVVATAENIDRDMVSAHTDRQTEKSP